MGRKTTNSRPSKRRRLEKNDELPSSLGMDQAVDLYAGTDQNTEPEKDMDGDVQSNATSPRQVIESTALSNSKFTKPSMSTSSYHTSRDEPSMSLTLTEIDDLLGAEEDYVGTGENWVDDKAQDEIVCFGMVSQR